MSIIHQTNRIREVFQKLRAAQSIYDTAHADYMRAKPRYRNPTVEAEHQFLKASWALEAASYKLAQAKAVWHSIRHPTLH